MSDFCPSDPLLEVSESDVQPSDTSESVRRPNYGVRVRPMSDKMGSDPSLLYTLTNALFMYYFTWNNHCMFAVYKFLFH